MALAEVARFASLSEAQVAGSALRASGFQSVVLDQEPAQALWREPWGQGGVRLCVPEDEQASARAFLDGLRADAGPDAPAPPARAGLLRLAAVAVVLLALVAFALLGRL